MLRHAAQFIILSMVAASNFFQSPCCECVHRDQSGTYTSDRCCLCLVDKCPCGATKLSDHGVYCSPCNCKCGIVYDDKAHKLACKPCNCPCGACVDGYGNPYCCECPNGGNHPDKSTDDEDDKVSTYTG